MVALLRYLIPILFVVGSVLTLFALLAGSTSVVTDSSFQDDTTRLIASDGKDSTRIRPIRKPTDNRTPPTITTMDVQGDASPTFPWYGLVLGVAVFGGAVAVILGNTRTTKIVGLTLSTTAASILAFKELDLLKVTVKVPINWRLILSQTGPPLEYKELPRIGPFETGEDSVLSDSARAAFPGLVNSINQYLEDGSTAFVFIAGGADRRQLSQFLRETYGSNEGLANARAVWVKSRLENDDSVPILTWGSGAKDPEPSPTREQWAQLRYVRVFIARVRD